MVVRGPALLFMSPQQQHEFNFPYQIGSADAMADTPAVSPPALPMPPPTQLCAISACARSGSCSALASVSLPRSCGYCSVPTRCLYSPMPAAAPQVAQRFSIDVREGDVVVAATDGLFDNVYPDEAAAIVSATKVCVGEGGGWGLTLGLRERGWGGEGGMLRAALLLFLLLLVIEITREHAVRVW